MPSGRKLQASFLYIYNEKICIVLSVLRRIGKLVISLLIPVLVLFIVNSTINRHDHMIGGYVYTHAHPYQTDKAGDPFQNHSHSVLALALLDILSDFEILVTILVLSLFIHSKPKPIAYFLSLRVQRVYRFMTLIPRAPPQFV